MSDVTYFLKSVKALFPIYGSYEKRFYLDLENNVFEYVQNNKNITFEHLVENFGSPNIIIGDYLSAIDTEYLAKQLKRSRHIRFLSIGIIAALFILLGIWEFYNYKSYHEFKSALPAITETTIESD